MKRTRFISAALIAALGLTFIGCAGSSGSSGDDGNNAVTSSKASELKVNLKNVKYLATQFVQSNSSTRADSTSEENSLLAVMEDGNTTTAKDLLNLDNYESGAKMRPVREVYKNTKGDDSAKGTYIVFDWYNDGLKNKEGKAAPLGQIVFICDKDGQTYDIFNKNGDVKRVANSWHKEYSGKDYIKFDDAGNIYIFGKEGGENPVIYKWTPSTQELKSFNLGNRKNVNFQLFEVTGGGDWIFTYATYGEKDAKDNAQNSGVYGFKVNGSGDAVVYYETNNEKQQYRYPVKGLTVNNDKLFYYISGYYSLGREEGGLYEVSRTSDGYTVENKRRFYLATFDYLWRYVLSIVRDEDILEWEDAKKYRLDIAHVKAAREAGKLDYTKVLNYIKSFCNDKDVDFSLQYFADKGNITLKFNNGTEFSHNNSLLQSKSNLKNEEALEFLFETPASRHALDEDREEQGDNVFMNDFILFCNGSLGKQDYKTKMAPLFLEHLLVNKTNPSAKTFSSRELTYMRSEYIEMENFLFVSNDEGTCGYNDHAVKNDSGEWENQYAKIARITENNGDFTENPSTENLKTLEFYPSWDGIEHEPTDPWKKLPYAVNKKGIAAISKDQKTIYYTSGNTTVNLLENDSNKSSISSIYSISLDEDTLIYNAVKKSGGQIMVSIDLATKEATPLPLTQKIETMIKLK